MHLWCDRDIYWSKWSFECLQIGKIRQRITQRHWSLNKWNKMWSDVANPIHTQVHRASALTCAQFRFVPKSMPMHGAWLTYVFSKAVYRCLRKIPCKTLQKAYKVRMRMHLIRNQKIFRLHTSSSGANTVRTLNVGNQTWVEQKPNCPNLKLLLYSRLQGFAASGKKFKHLRYGFLHTASIFSENTSRRVQLIKYAHFCECLYKSAEN